VRPVAHVFAYGSLARDHGGRPARLRGARRAWGVAMDNRHAIPGYKVWLDPADGTRPRVHVAFLDLVPAAARAAVTGILLPVSRAALARLDARERNYARVDVTDRVEADRLPAGARVWSYVGSAAGRARFRAGQAAGSAVVAGTYLDAVRAAFSSAIPAPPVPVRRLVRRDVPPPR
jgi:hypothetical protein